MKNSVITLLESTYSSSSDKERKESEELLEKLSQEYVQFLEILAVIILDPSGNNFTSNAFMRLD